MLVELGLPLVVLVVLVVTFEAAVGLTVMNAPDRKKRAWTARDRFRVKLIWTVALSLWPTVGAVVAAEVYVPAPHGVAGMTAMAAIATPLVWWLRHSLRRALRLEAGQCVACGYDLRGPGTSAIPEHCPECGEHVDAWRVDPDSGRLLREPAGTA